MSTFPGLAMPYRANPRQGGPMSPWFLLAVLVVIAVAAPRYGVDSRWPGPGEPPPPRPRVRVRDDIGRLVQAVQSHTPRAKTSTARPPSSRRSAV